MGIPAINGQNNNDLWKLYGQQQVAAGQNKNPWEKQGNPTTTTGYQAYAGGGINGLVDKFNAMDAKAVTGNNGNDVTGINPFTNAQPVTEVAAVKQTTPQNQQLFNNLENTNGELSPDTRTAEKGNKLYLMA